MRAEKEKEIESLKAELEEVTRVSKEKLKEEKKFLREENARVAEEKSRLEASFSAKRLELERSFEEKESTMTSECAAKVAASKAAAASEFKAAASLQIKVKELSRKIAGMEKKQDDKKTAANMNVLPASTPTTATKKQTILAASTGTGSLLLKSGGPQRVVLREHNEKDSPAAKILKTHQNGDVKTSGHSGEQQQQQQQQQHFIEDSSTNT